MKSFIPLSLISQRATSLLTSHHIHGPNCPCNLSKNFNFMNRGMKAIRESAYWQRQSSHDLLLPSERVITSASIRESHMKKKFSSGSTLFRGLSTTSASNLVTYDYAFDMVGSHIRFGPGVSTEVGFELKQMITSSGRIMVLTDPYLHKLSLSNQGPLPSILQSLQDHKVRFELYSNVQVEPTSTSFQNASKFAIEMGPFDAFVAVGGGSVMDTSKAANLYSTYPADFLDYVNAPIGKAKPPPGPLKPLIAIPTTAGTGSETTGVAIFDLESMNAKTGIAHRLLRPTLALIDPHSTRTMPKSVIAASGFDVLSHALESFTAIKYYERSPKPENPGKRPAYQGSNPISDVWCKAALEILSKTFRQAYHHPEDDSARAQMMLAATYAGTSLANSGVHLPHGMSYAISGNVNGYSPKDWPDKLTDIIPHGYSVILSAPAVFRWTAQANPARHLEAALAMGAPSNTRMEDAGKAISNLLIPLMQELGVPNGLKGIGIDESKIPALVEGTLPQHRVTKLAPKQADKEALAHLFSEGMTLF